MPEPIPQRFGRAFETPANASALDHDVACVPLTADLDLSERDQLRLHLRIVPPSPVSPRPTRRTHPCRGHGRNTMSSSCAGYEAPRRERRLIRIWRQPPPSAGEPPFEPAPSPYSCLLYTSPSPRD